MSVRAPLVVMVFAKTVNSYVCECSFGYTGLYCDICKYRYDFNFLSKQQQILNKMFEIIPENIQ